jgi:hypothetical protein
MDVKYMTKEIIRMKGIRASEVELLHFWRTQINLAFSSWQESEVLHVPYPRQQDRLED